MKKISCLFFIMACASHVCLGAEAMWSLHCKVEASEGHYPPRTDFSIESKDLKVGEEFIGDPPRNTPVYIPFYKEWNETFWINRETGEFLHIRRSDSWSERGHCELKTTDLKF
jgi:hypothetical protein